MEKQKWFDRKFDFTFGIERYSVIYENLSSTSTRLAAIVTGLNTATLEYKNEQKWSIKEHIGHLIDLEPLWQGRIEDVVKGCKYLRSTDLNNSKTDNAKHNQSTIEDLLKRFLAERKKTLEQVSLLDENILLNTSLHPRLEEPMRILDLLHFVSEHDQHHLSDIEQLKVDFH